MSQWSYDKFNKYIICNYHYIFSLKSPTLLPNGTKQRWEILSTEKSDDAKFSLNTSFDEFNLCFSQTFFLLSPFAFEIFHFLSNLFLFIVVTTKHAKAFLQRPFALQNQIVYGFLSLSNGTHQTEKGKKKVVSYLNLSQKDRQRKRKDKDKEKYKRTSWKKKRRRKRER